MQYTENYHFPIYEASDKPSAANWNNCFETIDETMGKGGHEILDNAGDTVEQKDKLQFKTPLTVGNKDDATVVNVDMNVDLSDFVPPSQTVLNNAILVFDTNEQKVGRWINGDDLYQITKVVDISRSHTTVNVSSLNVKKFVSNTAIYVKTNDGDTLTLPYHYDTVSAAIVMKRDNVNVDIDISSNYIGGTCWLTIVYTKNSVQ